MSICRVSDGLRDVISHSVLSLIKWHSCHGSPTKASPSSQRMESDRPIRAGCIDMQSAVITAVRKERRVAEAVQPDTPLNAPTSRVEHVGFVYS